MSNAQLHVSRGDEHCHAVLLFKKVSINPFLGKKCEVGMFEKRPPPKKKSHVCECEGGSVCIFVCGYVCFSMNRQAESGPAREEARKLEAELLKKTKTWKQRC